MGQRIFVSSLLLSSLVLFACAGQSQNEKMVPEDAQQRSKERYGKQKMYMNSLNQTPAEQAGSIHRDSVQPVENPNRKGRDR